VSVKSVCRIRGAIKLTDCPDGIGIPIYSHHRDNKLYIGKTDYDLRITRFIEFDEADHYNIDHDIAETIKRPMFGIGDYTPIPYWVNGTGAILSGGIDLDDFDRAFGASHAADSVAADLRRIIYRGRTGEYQRQFAEHHTKTFRHEYEDVFDEYPVNSRYWVSRYRSAVLRASKLPEEVARVAQQDLKNIVLEWIRHFHVKGQFRFLMNLLNTAENGILDREEMRRCGLYCLPRYCRACRAVTSSL
jgi:hypothetical protein